MVKIDYLIREDNTQKIFLSENDIGVTEILKNIIHIFLILLKEKNLF